MRARNFLIRRSASRASLDHDMYLRAGLVVRLYSSRNAAGSYKGCLSLQAEHSVPTARHGALLCTTRRDCAGWLDHGEGVAIGDMKGSRVNIKDNIKGLILGFKATETAILSQQRAPGRLTDLDDVEELVSVGVLEGVAGLKILGKAHEARDVEGDAQRDVVHVQLRACRQLRHVPDDLGQRLDDIREAIPAMHSSSVSAISLTDLCAHLHVDGFKC